MVHLLCQMISSGVVPTVLILLVSDDVIIASHDIFNCRSILIRKT